MKRKELGEILTQRELASGIFSMELKVSFADQVRAGQFVSLFSKDRSRLLPRPISVCETDAENGTIRLVYRTAGAGTTEFSQMAEGEKLAVFGPLGNGFPTRKALGKKVLLVGGGIGIPPMVSCARELELVGELNPEYRTQMTFAVGYRSFETYLLDELEDLAPTFVSTDDGSLGTKGTVLDAIREQKIEADLVFACGPMPMLRGIKEYAKEKGIPCYISMEERMACGIGVCLGCVCKTQEVDDHSKVKNTRICKDGPVFDAEEVDLS